jgi:hypothetical protein
VLVQALAGSRPDFVFDMDRYICPGCQGVLVHTDGKTVSMSLQERCSKESDHSFTLQGDGFGQVSCNQACARMWCNLFPSRPLWPKCHPINYEFVLVLL